MVAVLVVVAVLSDGSVTVRPSPLSMILTTTAKGVAFSSV